MVLGLSQYYINKRKWRDSTCACSRRFQAPFRGEWLGIPSPGFLFTKPRIAAMPLSALHLTTYSPRPRTGWGQFPVVLGRHPRRGVLQCIMGCVGPNSQSAQSLSADTGWYACMFDVGFAVIICQRRASTSPPRGVLYIRCPTPLPAR